MKDALQLTTDEILHILRNPYGKTPEEIREAALAAANLIEQFQDAYLNMRKFAQDMGLDTTTRHGGKNL